jgi:hypothetical protein
LLLTVKSSDDKYLYLTKVEKTQKNLKALRREFGQHTKTPLHGDFDRGYFQALEAYVRVLERSNPGEHPANTKQEE